MNNEPSWAGDPIITIATSELTRRGLDPQAYMARSFDNGEILVVVFRDRKIPPNSRAASTEHPTLEVEVSAKTKRVIRSYFAR